MKRQDPSLTRQDEAIIDSLYATMRDPDLWTGVLETISERVGADGATMGVVPDPYLGYLTSGFITERLAHYLRAGVIHYDPRQERGYTQAPRFLSERDLCTPWEIENLPFFTQYLAPLDIGGSLSSHFMNERIGQCGISFDRRRSRGPFTPDASVYLDTLRPHIERAVGSVSITETSRQKSVLNALGYLGFAAAFMGLSGLPLQTNRAFDDVRKPLFGQRSSLAGPSTTPAGQKLETALAPFRASWVGMQKEKPSKTVATFSADGQEPYLLHLLRNFEGPATLSPAVLLIVTRVGQGQTISAPIIAFLFDLTSAEAAIARDIGLGKSPAQIAAARRLSDHTVRDHLKRIYDKLDVHKQADLMRLMQQPFAPFNMPR